MWCLFVVVGLWSVAFIPFTSCQPVSFCNLELPCPESLWLVASAQEWEAMSATPPSPRTLQSVLDDLFQDEAYTSNGLGALCLLVGILLRSQQLFRVSRSVDDQLLQRGLNQWRRGYDATDVGNATTNFIALPAAAYLSMSFKVDATAMMDSFNRCRFEEMRQTLRNGNLRQAGLRACQAFVPWATMRKNRTSMTFIPCGTLRSPWLIFGAPRISHGCLHGHFFTTFCETGLISTTAIVTFEAYVLLRELHSSDAFAANDMHTICDGLSLSQTNTKTWDLWRVLQKYILNGPGLYFQREDTSCFLD